MLKEVFSVISDSEAEMNTSNVKSTQNINK